MLTVSLVVLFVWNRVGLLVYASGSLLYVLGKTTARLAYITELLDMKIKESRAPESDDLTGAASRCDFADGSGYLEIKSWNGKTYVTKEVKNAHT